MFTKTFSILFVAALAIAYTPLAIAGGGRGRRHDHYSDVSRPGSDFDYTDELGRVTALLCFLNTGSRRAETGDRKSGSTKIFVGPVLYRSLDFRCRWQKFPKSTHPL